jgi:DNA polymerase I-like protein with 3'-5' exonuclease and polymerase domains
MNKNKLLNYMIQATETEHNINTIIELQRYLYKKKTRLILYVYDSFLIDYSEEDGDQLLNDIQDILEQTKYMVRIQKGKNYGF